MLESSVNIGWSKFIVLDSMLRVESKTVIPVDEMTIYFPLFNFFIWGKFPIDIEIIE